MSVSATVAELKHLDIADSPMMIQPFMNSVVQEGETSIFIFNGQVGHAVRSNTQPDDYRVQFEHGGVTIPLKEISNEMLELVQAAIAACPETPIYARIDMICNTSTGRLCIIEVELIEPNLYLEYAPDEGMNFVRAVLQFSEISNHE